jgi:peptidyl-dipeptidase Dcp
MSSSLISWTDATYAKHGVSTPHGCRPTTYLTLSGTMRCATTWSFPQVLENLAAYAPVLNRFALHHQTGKPIPWCH